MKCLKHRDREVAGFLIKNGMRFDLCRECLDAAIRAGEVVSSSVPDMLGGRNLTPAGTIKEGMRVLVFDSRLYKDDVKTPLSVTMQPATVLKVYTLVGREVEVADVKFDRDGWASHMHFTWGIQPLEGP